MMVEHIGKMRRLRELDLRGNNLQGHGFIYIEKLGDLKVLDLYSDLLTDAALDHVAALPGLEELKLTLPKNVTSQGVAKLKPLKSLKKLDLSRDNKHQLKDDGVAHLTSLVGLEELNLSDCDAITDAALDSIAKLPKLKVLNLQNCEQITNNGIRALITGDPELKEICLSYCNLISYSAVQALKRAYKGLIVT